MRRLVMVMMCALWSLGAPVRAEPKPFRAEGASWSLTIPDGWVQASPEAVAFASQQISGLVGPGGGSVVAAFYPEGGSLLEFPYVLVMQVREDMTKYTWAGIERGVTGTRAVQEAQKLVDEKLGGLELKIQAPVIDRARGTISRVQPTRLADGSEVVCRSTGFFARDGVIYVNSYAAATGGAGDAAMASFGSSFAIDESARFVPKSSGGAVVVGAAAGGAAGLIAMIAAKKRRKRLAEMASSAGSA